MPYYNINEFAKMAVAAAVPIPQVPNWLIQQWVKLTDRERFNTIASDIAYLPVYRRQLVNAASLLNRAEAAGWDREKVSQGRKLVADGARELLRMSNMVQVLIAKAVELKRLPDSFRPELAGDEDKKVPSVGPTTAETLATLLLAGVAVAVAVWIAPVSVLCGVLAGLTALLASAAAFVSVAAKSIVSAGEPLIEFTHSAVWIVAIVAAAAGVWFLSSRTRRVAR